MTPTISAVPSDNSPSEVQFHLNYLDGLRGLAALYVVIYHIYFKIAQKQGDIMGMPAWASWMNYGHFAVDIFIVLSGFCLMLPIARSGSNHLNYGFRDYIRRRALRILPPYYAALFFSILLLLLSSAVGKGSKRDISLDINLPVILSHITLLHNIRQDWATRINAPMWSVATEWQIYFLFPLFLPPIWRKLGNACTVAIAVIVGVAAHYLFDGALDSACPWFLGLFAMGMVGAMLSYSSKGTKTIMYWRVAYIALVLILVALVFCLPQSLHSYIWATDVIVGATTSSFLVYCTLSKRNRTNLPPILPISFLESYAPVQLGKFSYSLYLVHSPLLALVYLVARHKSLPITQSFALLLGAGLPMTIITAYLFYLAFERPFLLRRSSTR